MHCQNTAPQGGKSVKPKVVCVIFLFLPFWISPSARNVLVYDQFMWKR